MVLKLFSLLNPMEYTLWYCQWNYCQLWNIEHISSWPQWFCWRRSMCHLSKTSQHLYWSKEYNLDSNTKMMFKECVAINKQNWKNFKLQSIFSAYYEYLNGSLIQLMDNKLVLFKHIFKNLKYITLVFIHIGICCKIFNSYHTCPSGGHMGVYKITFCVRM